MHNWLKGNGRPWSILFFLYNSKCSTCNSASVMSSEAQFSVNPISNYFSVVLQHKMFNCSQFAKYTYSICVYSSRLDQIYLLHIAYFVVHSSSLYMVPHCHMDCLLRASIWLAYFRLLIKQRFLIRPFRLLLRKTAAPIYPVSPHLV